MEIQIREQTKEESDTFFRIQGSIDVPVHGEVWGTLRYERLSFPCLFCRCIGHTLKQCEKAPETLSEEEKETLGYGKWLQVDTESSILYASCTMKVDIE